MTHLLDTNSCVDHLRRGPSSLVSVRLLNARPGDVVICSVVLAELLFGANGSAQTARNLAQVRAFSAGFTSLPFDDRSAVDYADIRSHLDRIGTPIGPNDLIIAAIARSRQLVVVTHNTSEFSRVPGLIVEDWQIP